MDDVDFEVFQTDVLFGRPCVRTFVISAEAAYVTSCQAHEMVLYCYSGCSFVSINLYVFRNLFFLFS